MRKICEKSRKRTVKISVLKRILRNSWRLEKVKCWKHNFGNIGECFHGRDNWRNESYCLNEIDSFFTSVIFAVWERRVSSLSTDNTSEASSCHVRCVLESDFTQSHVPSCACSPAGDQQSCSHVYRIIIFYASGMYPLIKECHLNWGFASLHMAGWACVPQEKQVQHDSSQEGFKSFWGPVEQINSSKNSNKSNFTHFLAMSNYNKCYVTFGTKLRSRLLFYFVLLIQI